MAGYYIVPPWFFGYDVVFELLFAVVTLVVGIYAFRVYRLSQQEQPKFFSIAFLLVSVSYFAKSVLNFMVFTQLNGPASILLRLETVTLFNTLGMLFHIVFFTSGLALLAYMTFRIKSARVYSLLVITLCLSLIFNHHRGAVFYLITSVMLLYICGFYLVNYIRNKQHRTLLVLLAFVFLLIGHATYIFSETGPLPYAVGHFLEFVAYSLILLNLILVVRKVRK